MTLARCGYVVVSRDCRGTGDSEPDSWDYYVYEREDSFDLVDWVTGQDWFDGFVAGCGGSYLGGTQWCMAMHPRMSTIVPEVCGIGIAPRPVRCHLLLEAYARSVGKGADKVPVGYDELERLIMKETLAGGYFNEPLHQPFSDALLATYPQLTSLRAVDAKRWLWERYSSLAPAQRADDQAGRWHEQHHCRGRGSFVRDVRQPDRSRRAFAPAPQRHSGIGLGRGTGVGRNWLVRLVSRRRTCDLARAAAFGA